MLTLGTVAKWVGDLHPRDEHGRFISKGGHVQLPDGSVGTVISGHHSASGPTITVQRSDGSKTNIASSQTKVTTAKPSADPVAAPAHLQPIAPSRGTPASIHNTQPGHRMVVNRGGTGTVTNVRPNSGNPIATYREDGSGQFRTARLHSMTHLGPRDSSRGVPSTPQNLNPGHRIVVKDGGTGMVTAVHDRPGGVATATYLEDGSNKPRITRVDNTTHLGPRPSEQQAAPEVPPGPPVPGTITADDARGKFIEAQLKKYKDQSTDKQFFDPKTKTWDPARAALQDQIVNDLYAQYANVPSDRKAIIAGGLPGAGKTTILTKYAGIPQDQYVTLNPDIVKEELIKRGMAPQIPGLTPMESVAMIHQESSSITKQLAARALHDKKNVLWDITMSDPESISSRVDALKANGYSTHGVFVSTTLQKSMENAQNRWSGGVARFNSGEDPLGGRFIPAHISLQAASDNATYRSKNEDTFSQMRRNFDTWELWDNSSNQHRFVTRKEMATIPENNPLPSLDDPSSPLSQAYADAHPPAIAVGEHISVPREGTSGVVTLAPGGTTLIAYRDDHSGITRYANSVDVTRAPAGGAPEAPAVPTPPEPASVGWDQNRVPLKVGSQVRYRSVDHQGVTTTGIGTVSGPGAQGGIAVETPNGTQNFRPPQLESFTPPSPTITDAHAPDAPTPNVVANPTPEPPIPGARVSSLAGIPLLGSSDPTLARQRLTDLATRFDETGSVARANGIRSVASAPDFQVSPSGKVASGTIDGKLNVIATGNGTPLRPMGTAEPTDPAALLRELDSLGIPFHDPQATANRWDDPAQKRADAQAVRDVWAPAIPAAQTAPTGSPMAHRIVGQDRNGVSLHRGDTISYTDTFGRPGTAVVDRQSPVGDILATDPSGDVRALRPSEVTVMPPGGGSSSLGNDISGTPINHGDTVSIPGRYGGPDVTGTVTGTSPLESGSGVVVRDGNGDIHIANPSTVTRLDPSATASRYGTPPAVGDTITVPGGSQGTVTNVSPSASRPGDAVVTYRNATGGIESARLSEIHAEAQAGTPVDSTGATLTPGSTVTWPDTRTQQGGTGTVRGIRAAREWDTVAPGHTHNVSILSNEGEARTIANHRLTAWQPSPGDQIVANGQRGTVQRVVAPKPADGFGGFVTYTTPDGRVRTALPSDVQPAPPPLPAIDMPPGDPAAFRRWGARAAEIANNGGPNLTAEGLNLRQAAQAEAFKNSLTNMYNGSSGLGKNKDYKVEISSVTNYGGQITYLGTVIAPDGSRAGGFTRTVHFGRTGKPTEIHNDLMSLNPEHQGQGIARDVYRRQENWAIANGIPKITVQANINVGGYTWGRLGYDWKSKASGRGYATSMLSSLRRGGRTTRPSAVGDRVQGPNGRAGTVTETSDAYGYPRYTVQWDGATAPEAGVRGYDITPLVDPKSKVMLDVNQILAKMQADPKYVPTPYELGQIGFSPGESMWPGKQYMLGTNWYGVKRLNPRNAQVNFGLQGRFDGDHKHFYGGDKLFTKGHKLPKWDELVKSCGTPKVTMLHPDEPLIATEDQPVAHILTKYLNDDVDRKFGAEPHPNNPIKVFVHKGRKHVINGHHRLLADRMRGRKSRALVIYGGFPSDDHDSGSDTPAPAPVTASGEFGWDEKLHPRDANGKFISKGDYVKLADGSTGKVIGSGKGKGDAVNLRVKRDNGTTTTVPAHTTTSANAFLGMRVIHSNPKVPAANLMKSIKDNGGFTYDPRRGGLLVPGKDKGFAVAVPGTEQIIGNGNVSRETFAKGVAKVMMQHRAEIRGGAMLGGWFSPDRNAYMVELTNILPQGDRAAAIAEGTKRNQEGIFDIGNAEYIPTGGTGG